MDEFDFLGQARGKPRLFNSRDESERFFYFSTKHDRYYIRNKV